VQKFIIYVADTETTGLDPAHNEIIEISFYRLFDNSQRTWCLKPSNYESIQPDALRINGHKLDDLKHLTKHGRDTYQHPTSAIVEIENWMTDDGAAAEDRILVGQNPSFDIEFMQNLWIKQNSAETFPFGRRPFLIDTRQIALFLDLVKSERSEFYNLGSLVEKYGVRREKAHRADSDTRMTKDLFLAQVEIVAGAFNVSGLKFSK
jgi:DNA polymerase III alpha subunit (gram-positive type)